MPVAEIRIESTIQGQRGEFTSCEKSTMPTGVGKVSGEAAGKGTKAALTKGNAGGVIHRKRFWWDVEDFVRKKDRV